MFQSSPAPRDGRYTPLETSAFWPFCFNPRPPRGTGATHVPGQNVGRFVVSILARPEGRALQKPGRRVGQHPPFQSSPAPRDGRYTGQPFQCRQYFLFQSSPAPRDGRYLMPPLCRRMALLFQSSPAPRDGRYKEILAKPASNPVVSILARPEGRALPSTTRLPSGVAKFQSSPAPRDGRYPGCCGIKRLAAVVSILARPEGRALQVGDFGGGFIDVFQSSPAPRDGRYQEHQVRLIVDAEFQSSPAPRDGRYIGL